METPVLPENPDALIAGFLKKNDFYTEEESAKIKSAWNFLIKKTAGSKDENGAEIFQHPYRVALIAAEHKLDADCVITALLSDVFANETAAENEIETEFGKSVLKLLKLEMKISSIHMNTKTLSQADAVRNMFFAITDDIRAIIIKLAERTDVMRNLKNRGEQTQKNISQETLDIWAPLADRLGMQQEKNELEDLSLKYLNPGAYQQIKSIVASKKNERSEYLEKTKQEIYKAASKAGLEISITSRAKHFYSIYQKMRKRNKNADELYDLLAIRILCSSNADCYTLLGIVHNLWKPLEGRFKDYIAMPKENGYQSLHTTVMAEDRPIEIQIRTTQMHAVAEHGVASHWLYKKGSTNDKVDIHSLPLFNQLQKLCGEHLTDEALFAEFKTNLLKDKIVVFTPKGDIMQLPVDSTAVDFAYAVHSKIGETIAAAKADGKIIPLSEPLQNTQIIEIITNPQSHPTENQLQYAKTYKAKQKIRAYLASHSADSVPAQKLNAPKPDENIKQFRAHKKGTNKNGAQKTTHSGKIKIGDTTNFVITIAGCCNPSYPDPITGYVSRTRGITIHKKDCAVYKRIPGIQTRSVQVEWDDAEPDK